MQELNLPPFEFRIRQKGDKKQIFDAIRKKFVALTPEEWVRQNFLQYMVQHKKFPSSLMVVEAAATINTMKKRADILVYSKQGVPEWMVECKAPEVKVTQDTFDQIAHYNMVFKVKYLVVTNGLHHYCCEMNYIENTYRYLELIPDYE